MKRKTSKRNFIFLAVLAAGLLGWAAYAKYGQTKKTTPQTAENPVSDAELGEHPVPADKVATLQPEPAPASSSPLAKPTLSKSSGNNGPVPAGILINFVCEGAKGLNCEVILTDSNDSTHQILLPKKPLADNGRGEVFASWDWNSIKGTWKVISKVTDGAGNSASSDIHTLTVQ